MVAAKTLATRVLLQALGLGYYAGRACQTFLPVRPQRGPVCGPCSTSGLIWVQQGPRPTHPGSLDNHRTGRVVANIQTIAES